MNRQLEKMGFLVDKHTSPRNYVVAMKKVADSDPVLEWLKTQESADEAVRAWIDAKIHERSGAFSNRVGK